MNIRDANPDGYGITVTSGVAPVTMNISMSCDFCGQHPWTTSCPRQTCVCGSSVTITAIDRMDGKRLRRCFRCGAVAIWEKDW